MKLNSFLIIWVLSISSSIAWCQALNIAEDDVVLEIIEDYIQEFEGCAEMPLLIHFNSLDLEEFYSDWNGFSARYFAKTIGVDSILFTINPEVDIGNIERNFPLFYTWLDDRFVGFYFFYEKRVIRNEKSIKKVVKKLKRAVEKCERWGYPTYVVCKSGNGYITNGPLKPY